MGLEDFAEKTEVDARKYVESKASNTWNEKFLTKHSDELNGSELTNLPNMVLFEKLQVLDLCSHQIGFVLEEALQKWFKGARNTL